MVSQQDLDRTRTVQQRVSRSPDRVIIESRVRLMDTVFIKTDFKLLIRANKQKKNKIVSQQDWNMH